MDNAKNGERILVCLSSSPSNKKVINAAIKMAEAFSANLTAIYVKSVNEAATSDSDRSRLQSNIKFAEQNGASIATVVGDDVSVQIAEFARISGTTKIVVGRSGAKRSHFFSKPPLTEQLILLAPDVDVYIIPDSAARIREQSWIRHTSRMYLTWKDAIITLLLLVASTVIGLIFMRLGFSESNIITVFILGVLITAVATISPINSAISSLLSVMLFNYLFIEPRYSFHTYETEYGVTFVIMLISALITGSLANKLKENALESSRSAFRSKVLFDTNQLLQKAENKNSAISITARQITTLLDRDVVFYPLNDDLKLGERLVFNAPHYDIVRSESDYNEQELVKWVLDNQKHAGCHSENFPNAKSLYYALSMNGYCYGIIGIYLNGEPLKAYEHSVFTSILGECALTLEGLRNAAEKEQATLRIRKEQLRSNLLRSISHDIRTPLTSISGNASNLLSHYKHLDDETLIQIYSDIYDDSEWLINLVENLLSISRIENGQMDLHLYPDVINDVIEEALKHIDKDAKNHHIILEPDNDIIIAVMDARLITQVMINLINNSIKNTQTGSEIRIKSQKKGSFVYVSVCDNGPGIPDNIKPHIFDMFNTGQSKISDGRRGLGLGLALCRSIVESHKGTITLTDNKPSGCCFTFSLPIGEVSLNE